MCFLLLYTAGPRTPPGLVFWYSFYVQWSVNSLVFCFQWSVHSSGFCLLVFIVLSSGLCTAPGFVFWCYCRVHRSVLSSGFYPLVFFMRPTVRALLLCVSSPFSFFRTSRVFLPNLQLLFVFLFCFWIQN